MATIKNKKAGFSGTKTKKSKSAAAEALVAHEGSILSPDQQIKTKRVGLSRAQAAKIREVVSPRAAAKKNPGGCKARGVLGDLSFATGSLIGKIKRLGKKS